jgi:hypothetical protein
MCLKARSQTSRANADELSILSMSSEQKIPALFKIKQVIAASYSLSSSAPSGLIERITKNASDLMMSWKLTEDHGVRCSVYLSPSSELV